MAEAPVKKPTKKEQKLQGEMARMGEILRILKREYPEAQCSLFFNNPFELLVATILSALCTDELVALRGVGRKTANVVLGNIFNTPGLVVDTHVGRLSRRMGFTRSEDPVKVEHEMEVIVPREDWTIYSHLMISHGRAICTARRAKCEECVISRYCPKIGVGH